MSNDGLVPAGCRSQDVERNDIDTLSDNTLGYPSRKVDAGLGAIPATFLNFADSKEITNSPAPQHLSTGSCFALKNQNVNAVHHQWQHRTIVLGKAARVVPRRQTTTGPTDHFEP